MMTAVCQVRSQH